jgi:hypothetical protein
VIGVPLIVVSVAIAAGQLYLQIKEAKAEATHAKDEAGRANRSAGDAASEARSTRKAIERTEVQLANNHLLARAGEVERLRDRLERAVADDHESDASQILRDWPLFASDLIAILELQKTGDHADAIKALEDSIAASSRAKDQIIGKKASLPEATQSGREQIDQACSAIARVASTLKFTRSIENG